MIETLFKTRRSRWIVLVIAALLAAAAAAAAHGGLWAHATTFRGTVLSDKKAGETMEVTSTQLGTVGPMSSKSTDIDYAPIVMWAGTKPAAMLRLELGHHEILHYLSVRFAPLDDRPHGPFPIKDSTFVPPSLRSEKELDTYDLDNVVPADLDGNGVEELVLFRPKAGTEAYSTERQLFKTHGPGLGVSPTTVSKVKLPGRDVLLAFYKGQPTAAEEALGAQHHYALEYIDGRGVTPIPLVDKAFQPTLIFAVGALNRPGSKELDEILVVSQIGSQDGDVFLSRHRLNGQLIEPPRKIYTDPRPSDGCRFVFVPQSDFALLSEQDGSDVFFLAPQKSVNWAKSVSLEDPTKNVHPVVLGAVGSARPKALVQEDNRLFLFDEDGKAYGWSGGALAPKREREPFFEVKPLTGGWLIGIFLAQESDTFLVVQARDEQFKTLSDEELLAAAKRFLPKEDLENELAQLQPTPDDGYESDLQEMMRERKAKGIDAPIQTVEEWRRLLPDSYKECLSRHKRNFYVSIKVDLFDPSPEAPKEYNDYSGYLAWRDAQRIPAGTVFTLLRRGTEVAHFSVPGAPKASHLADPEINLPRVSFRADKDGLTAVMGLEQLVAPNKTKPGFFLIQARGEK